jgi:hypothetical protein
MSGKGSRDRTNDRDAYEKSHDRIFNGTLNGGNTDSTKVSPLSDVGATPTSSTIDSSPFRVPPIRHGIRKIIE